MSRFSYENQGSTTYLVCTLEPEETLDTMSLGMITNNHISGLVSAIFMQMNAEQYIKYNVSSRIPVSQLFTGIVNKKRLLGVFQGVVNALLNAEDYMIDSDSLLLDLDYIFAEVSSCDTVLICLPVSVANRVHTDVGAFFKNIMFSTQFDQTENCSYVAKILSYLNSAPTFSVPNFAELIKEIQNESAPQPVYQQSVMPAAQFVQPAVSQPQQKPAQSQPVSPQPAQPSVRPAYQQAAQPGPAYQQPPQLAQSVPRQTQKTAASKPSGSPKPAVTPSFNIPNMPQAPGSCAQAVPPPAAAGGGEEKISLFYLLQHYNKDNAAIYKAQKEAAKQAKQAGAKQKSGKAEGKKKAAVQSQPVPGYAVPGRQEAPEAASGYAVLGQPGDPTAGSAGQAAHPAISVSPQSAVGSAGQAVHLAMFVPPQPAAGNAGQGVRPSMSMPVSPAPGSGMSSPQFMTADADFGDTVYMGEGDGESDDTVTRFNDPGQQIRPHLIRQSNNERIPIERELFRIGRDESYNDYVVSNNKSVGRSHCHIVSRDGEYFIVDDNSKNHTYVNGMEITSGTEVKLTHAAHISLSNEEFEFRLF